MKLITEPSVYLLGQSSVNEEELDRFLADHEVKNWSTDTEIGGEKLVEVAGRSCYMSYAKPRPGGNKAYIDHIKEVGHGSVLEHSVYTLMITGISRSCSHEFVRHRHLSPSQLSQRYVDESVAEYCVPPDLQEEIKAANWFVERQDKFFRDNPEANVFDGEEHEKFLVGTEYGKHTWENFISMVRAGENFLWCIREAHRGYELISNYLSDKVKRSYPDMAKTDARKFARQAARSVLPNATETKITMTGNIRAWRHFLNLRASRHADPEIRIMAKKVYDVLLNASPNLFSDYAATLLPDGTTELATIYNKA